MPDNKIFGGKSVGTDFFLNFLKGDLIAQPFERVVPPIAPPSKIRPY